MYPVQIHEDAIAAQLVSEEKAEAVAAVTERAVPPDVVV